MVQPLRTVLDRDEDVGNYKPLALLAVAAFGVSALFGGVVVILTIVGLVTRRSVLEPILIPLAFCGILLSIAARWQISLSEGTRDGKRLAAIAWWLSLIGGGIYTAYYLGNVMAIQSQAKSFAEDWMNLLKNGEHEKAFVYTIPPQQQKGMSAPDIQRRFAAMIGPFKDEKLPRLITRANGNYKLDSVGASEWKETPDGLNVLTKFALVTPEGDFFVLLPLVGVTNRDTGSREWYVNRSGIMVQDASLSTYGLLLKRIEGEAEQQLSEWVRDKIYGYWRVRLYLDTQKMGKEERLRRYYSTVGAALAMPIFADVTAAPNGGLPVDSLFRLLRYDDNINLYLPGFSKLPADLIRFDEKKTKLTAADKERIVPELLQPQYVQLSMQAAMSPEAQIKLEVLDNQLRATTGLDLTLPPPHNYRCTGRLVAVCDDPKLMAEINQRRKTLSSGGTLDELNTIWDACPHSWRIVELWVNPTQSVDDPRPVQTIDPRAHGGPGLGPSP